MRSRAMAVTSTRAIVAAMLVAAAAAPATAETLRDALVWAYENNPDLAAQRAFLQQTDEDVAVAVAGGRPTAEASVSFDNDFESIANFDTDQRALAARGDVIVPVYQGGRVKNAVRAAERRVDAGRQDLRAVESQVLLDAVVAYMDVVRDQAVVRLNENQVNVLERQLQASRDRFEVGDVTRTDVAQSEARLADARSNLTAAQAQLEVSRQAYRRVVGREPGNLEPPPALPALPASAEQAADLALADNPSVLAARFEEQAADSDVASSRGLMRPSVSANAGLFVQDYLGSLPDFVNLGGDDVEAGSTVGVSAVIPLYQGGEAAARVRSAKSRRSQALQERFGAERTAIQNARVAFSNHVASLATIDSFQSSVRANELAAEGTRQENLVGTRNILDVLDAEQELLTSRVNLVRAERNAYVTGFNLLSVTGQGEARDLQLPVNYYEPDAYYTQVRRRWTGTGVDVPVTTGAEASPSTGVTTPAN